MLIEGGEGGALLMRCEEGVKWLLKNVIWC